MAFIWKKHKDIWKGEGIYHLTFRVAEGVLLGKLCGRSREEIAAAVQPLKERGAACDVSNPGYVDVTKGLAWVELTEFGKAVLYDIANFEKRHDGVTVCQKIVMDTHIHLVVWVRKNTGQSILQIGQGFRTGITKIAREMGVWPLAEGQGMASDASRPLDRNAEMTDQDGADPRPEGEIPSPADSNSCHDEAVNGVNISSSCSDERPYHIFQKPYVRTLYAKGQLRTMIDYVMLNAYRKWIKRLYPELYTMHKLTVIRGLRFRSMGNHWLLDWPIRQMVECRRNATEAQLEAQLSEVMARAEMGAVTYTAAVNDGEWYIVNKVLEAGFHVVCHMKEGFPPVGSEAEKMYKPGGKMNDACGQGRLLLLEANVESYADPRVIELTEQALALKAIEKHQIYTCIPHETRRWRYIAGNEMMRLLQ